MASIRRVRRARRPFSLLAGGKRTPATFGNVRNSLGQAICQLECPIEEIFSRYLLFGARSWIAFLVTVGVPLNFTLGWRAHLPGKGIALRWPFDFSSCLLFV